MASQWALRRSGGQARSHHFIGWIQNMGRWWLSELVKCENPPKERPRPRPRPDIRLFKVSNPQACQFSSLDLSYLVVLVNRHQTCPAAPKTTRRTAVVARRSKFLNPRRSTAPCTTSSSPRPQPNPTGPTKTMFTTKVLRQVAAHAERTPSIRFIGKRTLPGMSDVPAGGNPSA